MYPRENDMKHPYSRIIMEKYQAERRTDTGWGRATYRKATEYRVTDLFRGVSASFWTKREAIAQGKAWEQDTQ